MLELQLSSLFQMQQNVRKCCGMKLKILQPARFGVTGPAFPETSREPTRERVEEGVHSDSSGASIASNGSRKQSQIARLVLASCLSKRIRHCSCVGPTLQHL